MYIVLCTAVNNNQLLSSLYLTYAPNMIGLENLLMMCAHILIQRNTIDIYKCIHSCSYPVEMVMQTIY